MKPSHSSANACENYTNNFNNKLKMKLCDGEYGATKKIYKLLLSQDKL